MFSRLFLGLGWPGIVTFDGFSTTNICIPTPNVYPTKAGISQTLDNLTKFTVNSTSDRKRVGSSSVEEYRPR